MTATETLDRTQDGTDLVAQAEACAAARDFVRARGLYETALPLLPPDGPRVRALAGFGWTTQALGETHRALALHEAALAEQLRRDAGGEVALMVIRAGIANALMALGRYDEALVQYGAVLSVQRAQPGHAAEAAATLNIMGEAAARLGHYSVAQRHQQDALTLLRQYLPPDSPEIAAALTNLGVSFYRLGEADEAETVLRAALAIDPDLLLAAENLIHVLYKQGRKSEGRALAEQKYSRQSFVVQPAPVHSIGGLLVLWSLDGNIPYHHLLARLPMTVIDWHIAYADPSHEARLPPYRAVFNLIGDADQGQIALEQAIAFQAHCPAPLLNDPAKVLRTRRHMVADLLAGIDGLVIPHVVQRTAAALQGRAAAAVVTEAGMHLPVLLRDAGMHGGMSVRRIETEAMFIEACEALDPADTVYLTSYHDYASPDGHFRKYRAIFVDRVPFAYHLAISPQWLVHYFSADMLEHPWKQAEELRYLVDMRSVVGDRAMTVLTEIARRMDLDYCGADFALLPDGRVLLFEANATMLVHPEEEDGRLAPKNQYVNRILAAFDTMVLRRIEAAA